MGKEKKIAVYDVGEEWIYWMIYHSVEDKGQVQLNQKEYESVQTQIHQRKDKIVFTKLDGDPISFINGWPLVSIETTKFRKPSNIILPGTEDIKRVVPVGAN